MRPSSSRKAELPKPEHKYKFPLSAKKSNSLGNSPMSTRGLQDRQRRRAIIAKLEEKRKSYQMQTSFNSRLYQQKLQSNIIKSRQSNAKQSIVKVSHNVSLTEDIDNENEEKATSPTRSPSPTLSPTVAQLMHNDHDDSSNSDVESYHSASSQISAAANRRRNIDRTPMSSSTPVSLRRRMRSVSPRPQQQSNNLRKKPNSNDSSLIHKFENLQSKHQCIEEGLVETQCYLQSERKRNKSLFEELKLKESTIAELTKEVSSLESSNAEYYDGMTTSAKRISALEKELQSSQNYHTNITSELEATKQELIDCQSELSHSKENSEDSDAMTSMLRQKLSDAQQMSIDWERKHSLLQQSFTQLQHKSQLERSELEAAQTQVSSWKQHVTQQHSKQEENIMKWKDKIDSIRNEKEDIIELISELNDQLSECYSGMEDNLENVYTKIDAIQALSERKIGAQSFQQCFQSMVDTFTQVLKRYSSSVSRVTDLQEENREQSRFVDEYTSKLSALNSQMTDLEGELIESQKRFKIEETENEKLNSKNDRLNGVISQLKSQSLLSESTIDDLQLENLRLGQSMIDFKNRISNLTTFRSKIALLYETLQDSNGATEADDDNNNSSDADLIAKLTQWIENHQSTLAETQQKISQLSDIFMQTSIAYQHKLAQLTNVITERVAIYESRVSILTTQTRKMENKMGSHSRLELEMESGITEHDCKGTNEEVLLQQRKMDELKKIIHAKSLIIEDLMAKRSKTYVDSLNKCIARAKQEIERLNTALDAERRRSKNLESDIDQLQNQFGSNVSFLVESGLDIDTTENPQDEIESLRAQVQQVTQERDSVAQDFDEVANEFSQMEELMSTTQLEKDNSSKQLDEVLQWFKAFSDCFVNLSSTEQSILANLILSAPESIKDVAMILVGGLQTTKENNSVTIDTQRDVTSMKSALHDLTAQKEKETTELTVKSVLDTIIHNVELNAVKQSSDNLLQSYDIKISKYQSTISKLTEQLKGTSNDIEILSLERNHAWKQYDEIQHKLAEMERDNYELTQLHQSISEEMETLRTDLKESQKKVSKLNSTEETLRRRENDVATLQHHIQNAQSTLQKITEQRNHFQQCYTNVQKDFALHQKQADMLFKSTCALMVQSWQPILAKIQQQNNFTTRLTTCQTRVAKLANHLRTKKANASIQTVAQMCQRSALYRSRLHADIHRFEFAKRLQNVQAGNASESQQLRAEIQRLNSGMADIMSQKAKLESSLTEKDEHWNSLQSQLTYANQRVSVLENKLSEVQSMNEAHLHQSEQSFRSTIEQLQGSIKAEKSTKIVLQSQHAQEIGTLQNQLEDIQNTLQQTSKNARKFQTKTLNLQKSIQKLETERDMIEQTADENQSFKERYNKIEKELKLSEKKCEDLQKVCKDYQVMVDALAEDRQTLEGQLEEKVDIHNRLNSVLDKKLEEITLSLKQASEECQIWKDRFNDKKSQLEESEERLSISQNSNRHLAEKAQSLTDDLNAIKAQNREQTETLSDMHENVKQELYQTMQRLEDTSNELDQLRLDCISKDSKVDTLQKRVTQLDTELTDTVKEYTTRQSIDEQNSTESIESLTHSHQKELESLRMISNAKDVRILQLEDDLQSNNQYLETMERKTTELETECESLRTNLETSELQHQKASDNSSELVEQLTRVQEKCRALAEDLQTQKETNITLSRELDRVQKELDNYKAQSEALTQKLFESPPQMDEIWSVSHNNNNTVNVNPSLQSADENAMPSVPLFNAMTMSTLSAQLPINDDAENDTLVQNLSNSDPSLATQLLANYRAKQASPNRAFASDSTHLYQNTKNLESPIKSSETLESKRKNGFGSASKLPPRVKAAAQMWLGGDSDDDVATQ